MATPSFISVFGRNLLHRNHPGQLVLFVTNRCNCRCEMCFNAANVFGSRHGPDLPLEDIRKIARSLCPLPQLLLSGGEPFLRDDIPEIITAFFEDAATRQFSIPTNGTFPDRIVSACREVLATCPNIILNLNLSLDSTGEEHDRLRGLTGCYERVCQTYSQLEDLRAAYRGLSVNINTILTEGTVEQADQIIADIRKHFAPNYHAIGILRGNYDEPVSEALQNVLIKKINLDVLEKSTFNALPMLGSIVSAMGALIKRRYLDSLREQRRCFTCLAGRKIIVITADGRLMPCEPLWLEEPSRQSPDEDWHLMARLEEYDYDVCAALSSERAERVKAFVAKERCWCSYVCAIQNGILYNPRMYPLILLGTWRR